MIEPRSAMAAVEASKPSALGIRPAGGQDPASTQKTVYVDRITQRAAGGSEISSFNLDLIDRTVACARLHIDPNDPDAGRQAGQTTEAVVAAMRAFKPMDEVEGMIAAQAVMLHHLAMEAGRRAMRSGQPPDVASKLRKDAANAARGMADMVDALARHRGKEPQVVRVERVVVNEGGQAVVGHIQASAARPRLVPTSGPVSLAGTMGDAEGNGGTDGFSNA